MNDGPTDRRRRLRIRFGLAALALTSVLLCACSAATSSNDLPQLGAGSLTVIDIEPADGASVNHESVIRAKLSYEIPKDYPGSYFLISQFATKTEGTTFDGSFPSNEKTFVQGPKGVVTVEFPLRHVLDKAELARPIKMWFYLNFRTGPRKSIVVARAGPFSFTER